MNFIQKGLLGLAAAPPPVFFLVDVGQHLNNLAVFQLKFQGSGRGLGHNIEDHGEVGGGLLRRVADPVEAVLAQHDKFLWADPF